MNSIKMIKDAQYVAEMLAAIFGAACATEAVFAGSEMLYKDMSALGNQTKEMLNPTVYKAKTGKFKKRNIAYGKENRQAGSSYEDSGIRH